MAYGRRASDERVKSCATYIQKSERYTFQSMLEELGLWKGVDNSGKQVFLSCPFHVDIKASFSINEEKKVCNCFACNRGGNYMSYLSLLHKELLNTGLNYFSLMQNILSADKMMQVELGFSSIYTEELSSEDRLDRLKNFKMPKFVRPQEKVMEDLSDLSEWMHSSGKTDISQIRLASLYMQEGRTPREIYRLLSGESISSAPRKSVDLSDILGDISFPDIKEEA